MAKAEPDVSIKMTVDASQVRSLLTVVEVNDERQRQIAKGWTHEHDDKEGPQHLVDEAIDRLTVSGWTNRETMIKAAALLIAAIETLDRKQSPDTN